MRPPGVAQVRYVAVRNRKVARKRINIGPTKKGEKEFMAHYCECRRRMVLKSSAGHARAGWIYRRRHDLCRKCWRSLVERRAMRSLGLARGSLSMFDGFEPKIGVRDFSLTLTVLAYKEGKREARSN